MKYVVIPVVVALAALRILRFRRRRAARAHGDGAPEKKRLGGMLPSFGGNVSLVAAREIRERVRTRVFRIGTLIILLAVAAAVIVPTLHRGSHATTRVGVVGGLSAVQHEVVLASGSSVGSRVILVSERSLRAADAALRGGQVAIVVDGGERVLTNQALTSGDTSTTALVARTLAGSLGLTNGLSRAGVPGSAIAGVLGSRPLTIQSLQPPRRNSTTRTTALYGLILTYVLLSQYATWLLMGVVEEKASRVIEVLLSTLRPSQLLAGKVLGIGAVTFLQSALIVGVALVLGAATGSDLLHGSAPISVVVILVWLVLAYTLYCWVWAAAGSLVERQSQVQSLAFPLQLPILFGYIVSLTAVASGNASPLVHVLAYVPFTASFAMPALAALGLATWWQEVLSGALLVATTVLVARLATTIYFRAILQTGGRVPLRQVLGRTRLRTAPAAAD